MWSSAALVAAAVVAHPQGFHKKTLVTVAADRTEVLVTLDVDSGKRAQLLRAGVDLDRDGALSDGELEGVREKLAALAVEPLAVEISGYRLVLQRAGGKLSSRDDRRASSDGGFSIAVLLAAEHPRPVTAGMTLRLTDRSPDQSHVKVEVHQRGGEEATVERELAKGGRLEVRLGRLEPSDGGS